MKRILMVAVAAFALAIPQFARASDEQQVVEEVAITVMHEVAHHFGIPEHRLHELGWG